MNFNIKIELCNCFAVYEINTTNKIYRLSVISITMDRKSVSKIRRKFIMYDIA